jgi:lipopolysaccharide export system protein LptA
MIKLFFNIFVAVLLSLSAFVNSSLGETKIGIESFQINPETDIEITSQSMVFNSKTNVTYGQLTLSAQSLTVSHSNKSDNYSNLTFFASGPIIINDNKNFIRGDQANFNGKNQELIIVGNVSLLQDSNKIFGDRLVLDLKEGIAKISGSVRTTIAPTGKNLK